MHPESPLQEKTKTLKKALIEIKKLKASLRSKSEICHEPIAVVGMGCRFPGGINSPDSYWEALLEKKDMIATIPEGRWTDYPKKKFEQDLFLQKAGFLLEDIEGFDAPLFRFSPREAERTDPQQRLFLKVCWEALENAGYIPNDLKTSKTGVYAGVSVFDHVQRLYSKQKDSDCEPHDVLGSGFSFISGRASYFFGFQGPAITTDTACSSSLVAVDQACKGLWTGDCDMALAGGVNLMLSPETSVLMASLNVLSPDCQVRSFDCGANGTVRGEGCGIVVLKRLSDAERDGDHVHSVIVGTATNQDGLSAGVTVPNGPAQERLIAGIWKRYKIDANQIDFLETHGTGTDLGDPIEVEAIGNLIPKDRNSPLYIGSVKTAIGHLEAAAGIAGLIKVILSVEKGKIPANLHFKNPSERIDWAKIPLQVPTENIAWNKKESVRTAGVSSFGLSGTNAHAVVEQYHSGSKIKGIIGNLATPNRRSPFRFSATDSVALKKQIKVFLQFLKKAPTGSIRDWSYAQNISRANLKEQIVLWVKDKIDLVEQLETLLNEGTPHYCQVRVGKVVGKKVVFLFSGTGSQYSGMFRDLYQENPVFKKYLDQCNRHYYSLKGNDLLPIIFSENDSKINQFGYTQVALFSVEYSLARMCMDYGVEPAYMIGHSAGEYVAACLAGVFDLESGIQLITTRGELVERLPKNGKMVAVRAPIEVLLEKRFNSYDISIAATNSPHQTIISGKSDRIDAFCQSLKADHISTIIIQETIAFHSPLMSPMIPDFEAVSRGIRYQKPNRNIVSNLSGKVIGDEMASYQYWSDHLTRSVKFKESIESLEDSSKYLFLELGPKRLLTQLVESIAGNTGDVLVLNEPGESSAYKLGRVLFALSNAGMRIDWKAYYRTDHFSKVAVPNYCFGEIHYSLGGISSPTNCVEESKHLVKASNRLKPSFKDLNQVRTYVRSSLAREWKIDEENLSYQENLLLRGLDSITMTKLISSWCEALMVPLKTAIFFTHPTMEEWAKFIFKAIQSGEITVDATTEFYTDTSNRYESFELTSVQNAYWVGRSREIQWGGFGCYGYIEINATGLDLDRFQIALNQLVVRHEMLRVVIGEDGKQRILRKLDYPLQVYRLRNIADLPLHLKKIKIEMARQTIPLGQPMFDLRLTERGNDQWRIHFGVDFIASDALSLSIFWHDLFKLYQGESLPKIEVSFRDYANYLIKRKNGSRYQTDKAYWMNRIDSLPAGPTLPVKKWEINQSWSQGKFAHLEKSLDSEKWGRFVREAAKRNLTPSVAMITLFSEVLSAWGAGENFGIMLTVFERKQVHPDVEKLIGDFTQLSLLSVVRKQRSMAENAKALQWQMQEDLEHLQFCAVDVVKKINQKRSGSFFYPVVFTSALGVGDEAIGFGNKNSFGELGDTVSQTPQVWLDSQLFLKNGQVSIAWDFLEEIFPHDMIDAMFAKYSRLIDQAIEEENFWEKTLIDLRTDSQKKHHASLIQPRKEPQMSLLHQGVISIAKKDPSRTAIVFNNQAYSFEQLVYRANQVSEWLQKNGLEKGTHIAIQMEKSFDAIAIVFGILQIGAVYIPLAHNNPANRTKEILKKADAKCLFTDRNFDFSDWILIPKSDLLDGLKGHWIPNKIENTDTGYIIYTSGSSGTPKGVVISHKAAMNTIEDVNRRFGITGRDCAIAISSLSFDLSVYDLFGVLGVGGKLVVPTEDQRLDPKEWQHLSNKYQITVWNSVPSLLSIYLDFLANQKPLSTDRNLKTILLSGDWIPLSTPKKIEQKLPNAKLVGLGGATEASIWSNYFEVDTLKKSWCSIPYGYPLANQSFYILDSFGRPCPDWVKGRLHIGGDGLAKEYWGEPELTQASFYHHPELGTRIYDTGDYGRYIENGMIEFLGREDDQLKINGYRVEIGEIKSALMTCNPTLEPFVCCVGDKMEDKKLMVYVLQEPQQFSEKILKEQLSDYLPPYFIPERIIPLAKYPKSENGKIDKKQLIQNIEKESVSILITDSKTNENQDDHPPILQVLQEVLNLPEIKPTHNFHDLGVSSMDMIRLSNHLESAFSDRPAVGEMMRYRQVSELIDYYKNKKTSLQTDFESTEGEAKVDAMVYSDLLENDGDSLEEQTLLPIMETCNNLGIHLWVQEDRLKFKAPDGAMNQELREKLKKNKDQLIQFLEKKGKVGLHSNRYLLTPIQWAYLSGRSSDFELGNVGAHYYAEIECPTESINKIESVLNQTISSHGALRTVIYEDGTQEVLQKVPHYRVNETKIKDSSQISQIRDSWSHHIYKLGQWPMFHFEISHFDNDRSRIHVSVDLLIMDAWSGDLLLDEIFKRISGKQINTPQLTFKDYIDKEKIWHQKNQHFLNKAQSYWREKIEKIPPAPALPYRKPLDQIETPRFKRLKFELPLEAIQGLTERSRVHQLTPTAVFCTAFMKLLSFWGEKSDLTLNMTLFNRLPVHKDAMRIFGDFTNLALISFYGHEKTPFLDEVNMVQNQLWQAIEHRAQNGLELVRDLGRNQPGKAVMPVVFTSLIASNPHQEQEPSFTDKVHEVFAISQTPQVVIDHHLYQRGGNYIVNWDVVDEAFETEELEEAFQTYKAFIDKVMMATNWSHPIEIEPMQLAVSI